MNDFLIKHDDTKGHGSYERRDIKPSDIVYFVLGLVIVTVLLAVLLMGFYRFLDKRDKAQQPAINPLLTDVPTDTLHIPRHYPESAFPEPRLEEDERGQLNGVRIQEEQTLNSYGWVDEKAGTVRIPIDRAMDLMTQRGLPVRAQGDADKENAPQAATANAQQAGSKKANKKEKQ